MNITVWQTGNYFQDGGCSAGNIPRQHRICRAAAQQGAQTEGPDIQLDPVLQNNQSHAHDADFLAQSYSVGLPPNTSPRTEGRLMTTQHTPPTRLGGNLLTAEVGSKAFIRGHTISTAYARGSLSKTMGCNQPGQCMLITSRQHYRSTDLAACGVHWLKSNQSLCLSLSICLLSWSTSCVHKPFHNQCTGSGARLCALLACDIVVCQKCPAPLGWSHSCL